MGTKIQEALLQYIKDQGENEKKDSDWTPLDKCVLQLIAHRMNDKNHLCYITIPSIAETLNIPLKSIYRTIGKLKKQKVIRVDRTGGSYKFYFLIPIISTAAVLDSTLEIKRQRPIQVFQNAPQNIQ